MSIALLAIAAAALIGQGSIFDEGPDTAVSSDILSGMESTVNDAANIGGAEMAVGMVDLATGERLTAGETGPVKFGNPQLVLAACAVDLLRRGEIALDDVPGGGQTISYLLAENMKGRADPGIILHYFIGAERFESWLTERSLDDTDYTDFRMHFSGAPEVEASTSSIDDMLSMVEILGEGLDYPGIRRALHSGFPRGPEVLRNLEGVVAYGVPAYEEDGESIAAIGMMPDGSRVGLVAVAEDPCCRGKAELAFSMMWNELLRQQGL
ncbi:MAG: hypothetical protein R6U36_05180 [Candidatus Fermentibacteraceae bacterium]